MASSTIPLWSELPWDSNHFGFLIGACNWHGEDDLIVQALADAKAAGCALLYVHTRPEQHLPPEAHQFVSEIFVSDSIDFVKEIAADSTSALSPQVTVLSPLNCPQDDCARLGISAGCYSRFVLDPRFDHERGKELFRIWAIRSLKRELADEVFGVFSDKERLVGMVTAQRKELSARVGIIAVDGSYQGQGFGKALLCAVEQWAKNQALQRLYVKTQVQNFAARRLYERTGFAVNRIERVIHLWLV